MLLFALTLAVARGPLAYAALCASAVLAWHLRSQLTPVVGVFAVLVSANILTWLTLPKPFAFFCNEAALSVVNPLSLAQFGELSAISNGRSPAASPALCIRLSIQWNDQVRSIPCGCQYGLLASFSLTLSEVFFANHRVAKISSDRRIKPTVHHPVHQVIY